MQAILNFCEQTGFYQFFQGDNWKCAIMIVVAIVLLFLGIVKKFEPLLLVPIAVGMLVTNLPGAEMYHEILFAGGHVHWDLFGGAPITAEFIAEMQAAGVSEAVLSGVAVGQTVSVGLIDVLYLGIKLGIYPCLIFMGVGAMTDFGPLIANPKSLLLGAAAQLGIFMTYVGCRLLGFTGAEASSIGIIGGADGPTAIFLSSKLAPNLMGAIAVSAYSYMALVPVIQPPIMRLLTTRHERLIKMKPARAVAQSEKIIFPIVGLLLTCFVVPSGLPLLGMLFFGNLLRESGVTTRLAKTASNAMTDIVTILLGLTVGASTQADKFLTADTIKIFALGFIAFIIASSAGVLSVKLMNLFLRKDKKVNPLIGNAGVSAVPMAARISNNVGLEYDPSNYLLMHAMGPNVAGVIGSAVAAGVLLSFLG